MVKQAKARAGRDREVFQIDAEDAPRRQQVPSIDNLEVVVSDSRRGVGCVGSAGLLCRWVDVGGIWADRLPEKDRARENAGGHKTGKVPREGSRLRSYSGQNAATN